MHTSQPLARVRHASATFRPKASMTSQIRSWTDARERLAMGRGWVPLRLLSFLADGRCVATLRLDDDAIYLNASSLFKKSCVSPNWTCQRSQWTPTHTLKPLPARRQGEARGRAFSDSVDAIHATQYTRPRQLPVDSSFLKRSPEV